MFGFPASGARWAVFMAKFSPLTPGRVAGGNQLTGRQLSSMSGDNSLTPPSGFTQRGHSLYTDIGETTGEVWCVYSELTVVQHHRTHTHTHHENTHTRVQAYSHTSTHVHTVIHSQTLSARTHTQTHSWNTRQDDKYPGDVCGSQSMSVVFATCRFSRWWRHAPTTRVCRAPAVCSVVFLFLIYLLFLWTSDLVICIYKFILLLVSLFRK